MQNSRRIVLGFGLVAAGLWLALYFATQPLPSRDTFDESSLDRFVDGKNPRLKEWLRTLLNPQTSIQSRTNGESLRAPDEIEELVYSLAPRLWFHSDEKQGASDPVDFLRQSELYYWRGQPWLPGLTKERKKLLSAGEVNPKLLAEKYRSPLLRPFEGGGINKGLSGIYLNYLGPRETAVTKAPLFWRISRNTGIEKFESADPNSMVVLIEYWLHSVDNPIPIYFGSHQGDWESFGFLVRLKISDTKKFGAEILAVYLSQHLYGQWVCPDDIEWETTAHGRRANLYSALGTHATYSRSGRGLAGILTDFTERGRDWRTWEWLSPLQLEPYYGYSGAWGRVSFHYAMTAPQPPGPRYKYLPNQREWSFDLKSCLKHD